MILKANDMSLPTLLQANDMSPYSYVEHTYDLVLNDMLSSDYIW